MEANRARPAEAGLARLPRGRPAAPDPAGLRRPRPPGAAEALRRAGALGRVAGRRLAGLRPGRPDRPGAAAGHAPACRAGADRPAGRGRRTAPLRRRRPRRLGIPPRPGPQRAVAGAPRGGDPPPPGLPGGPARRPACLARLALAAPRAGRRWRPRRGPGPPAGHRPRRRRDRQLSGTGARAGRRPAGRRRGVCRGGPARPLPADISARTWPGSRPGSATATGRPRTAGPPSRCARHGPSCATPMRTTPMSRTAHPDRAELSAATARLATSAGPSAGPAPPRPGRG